jgi:CheY-like chemotaxis protein
MPTILVVDDEPGIRLLMRQILETEGYRVREADEGFQALSLLLQGQIVDVVVSDLRMPRMDGFELASHMAALSLKVPILFVTGYTDDLEKTPLPGPVLPKPFLPEQLIAGVAKVRQLSSI